eukprot:COSAG04_NODE_341_length_16294_cov_8.682618_9_plen_111_part_00
MQAAGEEGDESDSGSDSEEEEELYPPEARHAIRQWSLGVAAAQMAAPRFKLRPGQAVLIDNFRLLHGRDPYFDLDRKLWRLWHWTEGAMDAPVDSTVIHTATGTTEPARL